MKLSRLLREQRDSARMSALGAHPYRTRAEHERRFGVRQQWWRDAQPGNEKSPAQPEG